MYRFLLCARYLRTRYIALTCIISVTLGVATMIVVNSVMSGFSSEMKDRIRGILEDVVVKSHNADGEPDPVASDDDQASGSQTPSTGLAQTGSSDQVTAPVIDLNDDGKSTVAIEGFIFLTGVIDIDSRTGDLWLEGDSTATYTGVSYTVISGMNVSLFVGVNGPELSGDLPADAVGVSLTGIDFTLLTYEGERVLRYQVVPVTAHSTTLLLPMKGEFSPNVFLRVAIPGARWHLVRLAHTAQAAAMPTRTMSAPVR